MRHGVAALAVFLACAGAASSASANPVPVDASRFRTASGEPATASKRHTERLRQFQEEAAERETAKEQKRAEEAVRAQREEARRIAEGNAREFPRAQELARQRLSGQPIDAVLSRAQSQGFNVIHAVLHDAVLTDGYVPKELAAMGIIGCRTASMDSEDCVPNGRFLSIAYPRQAGEAIVSFPDDPGGLQYVVPAAARGALPLPRATLKPEITVHMVAYHFERRKNPPGLVVLSADDYPALPQGWPGPVDRCYSHPLHFTPKATALPVTDDIWVFGCVTYGDSDRCDKNGNHFLLRNRSQTKAVKWTLSGPEPDGWSILEPGAAQTLPIDSDLVRRGGPIDVSVIACE